MYCPVSMTRLLQLEYQDGADCPAQRSRREPAVAGGPDGSGRSPTRFDRAPNWPSWPLRTGRLSARPRCSGCATGAGCRWRGRGRERAVGGWSPRQVQTDQKAARRPATLLLGARRHSPTDPFRRAAGGARRRRSVRAHGGQAEPSSHFQQPLSAVLPSRRG